MANNTNKSKQAVDDHVHHIECSLDFIQRGLSEGKVLYANKGNVWVTFWRIQEELEIAKLVIGDLREALRRERRK